MSSKKQVKGERSKLLATSIDSTQSEYESILRQSSNGCCDFIGGNKKPLITIAIIIFLGSIATLTMLYLDHEGFWNNSEPIDTSWFKQTLINSTNPFGLYPLWLQKANPNISETLYLYKTQYGENWNNDDTFCYNYSTLRTQCELIFNFATGYKITNNISYYIAMKNGIHVLLNRFNDSIYGGFYYSINETINNEIIIDATKDSIGHSLVINALSTAFIITNTSDTQIRELYLNILNITYTLFATYFFDEFDGIYCNLTNQWNIINESDSYKSQLPLMYHFEALKQLLTVSQSIYYTKYSNLLNLHRIQQDIVSIFEFVCDLLHPYTDNPVQYDYNVLFQDYNRNWTQPLSTSYASLGNALKWSFMIQLMSDKNIIQSNIAQHFLQYAIYLGYDEDLGKIHNLIYPPSKYANPPYWTVCNAIQTLVYFWRDLNNDQWLDILQNIIQFYQNNYYDIKFGGIYFSPPLQNWKGNISKVDKECIEMSLFVAQLSY